jgi:hypothetical protein
MYVVKMGGRYIYYSNRVSALYLGASFLCGARDSDADRRRRIAYLSARAGETTIHPRKFRWARQPSTDARGAARKW